MNRIGWIVLLGIAIVATLLLVTQGQNLSSVQVQLVDAQSELTKQAESAPVTATQAAVDQAQAVADAQDAAATTQAQTLADAQDEAATVQAQALADVQNQLATTQAETIMNVQLEATIDYVTGVAQVQESAATAQAQALTEAQDLAATAQAGAVAEVENQAATAQAEAILNAEATAASAQSAASTAESQAATAQANLLATITALEAQPTAIQATSTPMIMLTPLLSAPPVATGVYGDIPQSRLVDGGFVLGSPDAPITILEFGDYSCPPCQQYAPTITRFIDDYVRTGKARYEYRIFPTHGGQTTYFLGQIQVCLEEQKIGSYWEAKPVFLELASDGRYDMTSGEVVADRLGLDYGQAEECAATQTQIDTDVTLGRRVGIQGTPAVLVRHGDSKPEFIVLDGQTYDQGGVPYEVLAAVVDAGAESPAAVAVQAVSREGWQRFEGNGVSIELPPTWVGGDLANNPELLADAIDRMGPEYAGLGQMFIDNPDTIRLMAFDTEGSSGGLTTNVNIILQDLPIAMPLPAFMEAAAGGLPAGMTVIENDVVTINQVEVGRLIVEVDSYVGISRALEYVVLDEDQVWVISYTAAVDQFDAMLPIFEASFETFIKQSSAL